MLPFAFFGRQTLYCSEMVLLLCGSFQYNFVYWTTSRISEQLCFVKQQFSFVHIVFVGSTLTIYLKNEKYTLVGFNLSIVISLLVTSIFILWYRCGSEAGTDCFLWPWKRVYSSYLTGLPISLITSLPILYLFVSTILSVASCWLIDLLACSDYWFSGCPW